MTPAAPNRVGRYVIVDRIGRGGMGVVYRAWDPQLQRMIALKMLAQPIGSPHNPDAIERFAREARSAASLAHRHIVTIHDVGQHRGCPYLGMEFLDGESMAQVIDRRAALSITDKMRLALDLCEGLAFAHHRGVVHRDIKPGNLMITADGVLKILDFGLARASDELNQLGLTQTGALMGTLSYMSPEQALGRLADERSDIFAVGAVLYELFTYHKAFDAQVPSRVLLQLLHDAPRPPREIVPELPPTLEAAIVMALDKEPSRRYQRLDDLAADLQNILRETDGSDRAAPRWRPAPTRESAPEAATTVVAGLDAVLEDWGAFVGDALAEPTLEGDAPFTSDRESRPVQSVPTVPPAAGTTTPPPSLEPSIPAPAAPASRGTFALTGTLVAVVAVLLSVALYFAFRNAGPDSPEAVQSVAQPTEPAAAPGAIPAPEAVSDSNTAAVEGAGRRGDPPAQPSVSTGDAVPAAATPRTRVRPARCTALLERVGLGEELTAAERDFLARECRNGE